ncbi:mediator of RNA polymerase II transcription subunit [Elysia marginata]|uniref:Mediator of RNA polymerase II transcription subunit 15 n=1 Tax=Elysia marginata TaxID=1093978 RepID=A0AAV4EAF3_9GAST|nr:mediator of RNA polymerase II transcription subunit [Elysia marginata]
MADSENQTQVLSEGVQEPVKQIETEEEDIDTDEWKLEKYRIKVVERIQEEITKTESEVTKTATELEEFAFNRAVSKRTYLDCIARILVYVAQFNQKKVEKARAEEKGDDEEAETVKEEDGSEKPAES